MSRIGLIAIWMLSASVVIKIPVKPVFGVNVSIGPNSQITSFVCFLNNGRVLTQKRTLDRASFVKIVSGYWPSIYNPNRIDFFEQNNIDCSLIPDPVTNEKVIACVPMDSLWKIRFATYPFQTSAEMGWSNKYHKPSPKQEKYLYDRYGVGHIDAEYFLDTSFWMIMRDVNDPVWIANYKSLK